MEGIYYNRNGHLYYINGIGSVKGNGLKGIQILVLKSSIPRSESLQRILGLYLTMIIK